MRDFVLDCSVAISWILPDEYSDYAQNVFDLLDEQQTVVPSIWYLEIANVSRSQTQFQRGETLICDRQFTLKQPKKPP